MKSIKIILIIFVCILNTSCNALLHSGTISSKKLEKQFTEMNGAIPSNFSPENVSTLVIYTPTWLNAAQLYQSAYIDYYQELEVVRGDDVTILTEDLESSFYPFLLTIIRSNNSYRLELIDRINDKTYSNNIEYSIENIHEAHASYLTALRKKIKS